MAPNSSEFHDELQIRGAGRCSPRTGRSTGGSSSTPAGSGWRCPEQFGGAGATFAEVAVICSRRWAARPAANRYLGSGVLAVGALNALQPSDSRDRLLDGSSRRARRHGSVSRRTARVGPCRIRAGRRRCRRSCLFWSTMPRSPSTDVDRHTAARPRRDPPTGDGVRRRCRGVARCSGSTVMPAAAARRLRERAAVAVACDSLGLSRGDAGRDRRPTRRCGTSSAGRSDRSRPSSTPAPTCWSTISVSRQLVSAPPSTPSPRRDRTPASRSRWRSRYACGTAVDVVGQGDAAARRHRLHVGERHPRLPQTRRTQSFAVRITRGSPQRARKTLPVKGVSPWACPSTSAFSTCSRPRASTRCSASRIRTSCTCSSKPRRAAGSVVAPHHELSAGFMAEAASRMTGKPGLCIGTLGPGVANIAGAISAR